MKHTPAPWTIDSKDYDRFGQTVYIQGDNGQYVCEMVRDGYHKELQNAALIAAAPELLEALKALLIETDQHAEGDCPKLLEACQNARAIIKKAEGKA